MSIIKYIADHHAGGIANDKYAKSQHLTWQQINNAHKERWNFKSSLGYYGGYNFYVMADGSYKQFRAIGEETAAQVGYNLNTVSICLAGNFIFKKDGWTRIETPTSAQLFTRKKLIKQILEKDFTGISVAKNTVIDVKIENIHPHSFYQSTECNCFSDGWGREIYDKVEIEDNAKVKAQQGVILSLLDSIILLLSKLKVHISELFAPKELGRIDRSCDGMVLLEDNK